MKIILYCLACFFLIDGTLYVLAKNSEQPASMNMGDMGSMQSMAGMSKSTMSMASGRETSVTQLVETPADAPVKTFDLTAEEKDLSIGNGKKIRALTYNGTSPGSEIRVQQGDRVIVHVKNHLSEGVTIHWHGVELPNAEDGVAGVTQNAIPPAGEYTYNFIAKQPGTYWYHSHQESFKETTQGLYGVFVVEPKQSATHYDQDIAAALHDWDNKTFTVNGTSAGEHFSAKPGDLVRLRIVNTGNAKHMMTLIGAPFKVISIDAHDINGPTPLNQTLLPIAASQRYDIEFKMPENGAVKLVNADSNGESSNFFTTLLKKLFVPSSGAANQMLTATIGSGDSPVDLNSIKKNPVFDYTVYGSPMNDPNGLSINSNYSVQYDLSVGNSLGFFNGGFTMKFKINGAAFPDIQTLEVHKGDFVKIHMQNDTDIDHPLHLHGHSFKILEKNGKPLSGSPIYLSTIQVEPHESYDIAFIADNPGLWMLHCHNLAHAAQGMDMMVNYAGVTTPYTVGNKSGNHPD